MTVTAASVRPATAPQNEIGYQVPVRYAQMLDEVETTPELQFPQSIWVYDQMRRTDAQVGSVLRAVSWPVLRTPWRDAPAGARGVGGPVGAADPGVAILGAVPSPPLPAKVPLCLADRMAAVLRSRLGAGKADVMRQLVDQEM